MESQSYPRYPQKFGADYRVKDLFLKDTKGYYRRNPLSRMAQGLDECGVVRCYAKSRPMLRTFP